MSLLHRLTRAHRHKAHREEQEQIRRAGEAMRTAPLPTAPVDPGRPPHDHQAQQH